MIPTGCLYTSVKNQKSGDLKAMLEKLLHCGDKKKNKVNGYLGFDDGTQLCLADGSSW
jgi:hypothetical protein